MIVIKFCDGLVSLTIGQKYLLFINSSTSTKHTQAHSFAISYHVFGVVIRYLEDEYTGNVVHPGCLESVTHGADVVFIE